MLYNTFVILTSGQELRLTLSPPQRVVFHYEYEEKKDYLGTQWILSGQVQAPCKEA